MPADAGRRDKRCGMVASGAGDFRVSARTVRCDFAKRWTRAYLGRRSAPQGWQCYRPGRDIASYCTRLAGLLVVAAVSARNALARLLALLALAGAAAAHPGHGPEQVLVGRGAFTLPKGDDRYG